VEQEDAEAILQAIPFGPEPETAMGLRLAVREHLEVLAAPQAHLVQKLADDDKSRLLLLYDDALVCIDINPPGAEVSLETRNLAAACVSLSQTGVSEGGMRASLSAAWKFVFPVGDPIEVKGRIAYDTQDAAEAFARKLAANMGHSVFAKPS
jgi:hypothetical protein